MVKQKGKIVPQRPNSGLLSIKSKVIEQSSCYSKFVYNNTKNANTGYTFFELNCGHHPRISFENKIDSYSKSCSANKLSKKLRYLMLICQQNLLHIQDLQKLAYDKGIKPYSYTPGENIWLNSKYISTKKNQKLKAKFFSSFQVFHLVSKQIYKLELSARQKIHNFFHISLLRQNITKKRQVNKLFDPEPALDIKEDNKYKVEIIKNSAIYANENTRGQFSRLYYLIS